VPTGTQKVRPVGFATKSDQIDFRPTQPEVRVARTATYVVAASDAPDHIKRLADYVCDGIDDHEEIHAAIAALPENGGSICLSPGTFNASIRITKPNVHLFGTWATTIKTLDDIDTATNSNSATIRVFGDGCLIENLKFDGNLAGNPTLVGDFNACVRSDGIGIYANGCTVRNCWLVDTLGHSIIVWNEADPMGIAAESAARSYVTIEGNLFEGSGTNRARIDVARESASLDKINHHVIIRNNQIKNVGQSITIHGGFDIIVSGNQIDNAGYGIYPHNDLRNIVIAENVVTNITTGPGIRINSTASGASNIVVVDNVVATGVDAGIYISGPTTATIGHNRVMGCKQGIYTRSSGGVSPNDMLIVGNTIESTTEEAIYIRGGARHAILANRVDKSGYGAIRFSPSVTDCTVKENIIINAGTLVARDAVYFETPSRAVVEGNVIRGSTRDGVSFSSPAGADSTIRNNVISGCTGRSIKTTAVRTLIEGNVCDAASIEILSAAVDSRISQNTLTSGASLIVAASGAVVRGNGGFVTENSGAAASTADGGTIAHGCAAAPTTVTVSGSVAGEIVTVTSIDATNITVAIKAADGTTPGTSQTVYWRAEV
jgi:hypothetical protein